MNHFGPNRGSTCINANSRQPTRRKECKNARLQERRVSPKIPLNSHSSVVHHLVWDSGDTAVTASFAELRASGPGPIDLAIMPIGAYNPWIHSHCTPEQAVQMANEAGAHFIMPVHHQTFRLSSEDFREPIERFQAALHETPERIALREIGETFVLPWVPIFRSHR